ncbi:hypothetical protein DSM25558_4513 [Agrobacterium sp. DSM 25558]|nr:hypothetical protein DSM25558_4513 [Agrobacterium sp. DSM 25558]
MIVISQGVRVRANNTWDEIAILLPPRPSALDERNNKGTNPSFDLST